MQNQGLTYPTAWQPGASKTAIQASGFRQSFLVNHIWSELNFWSWTSGNCLIWRALKMIQIFYISIKLYLIMLFSCNSHVLPRPRSRSNKAYTICSLTHWGRETHIGVGKLTIIGRRQAIIWTIAGMLFIGPLGTNFSEILNGIQTFSFKKMHLKMSSAKWRPFVSAAGKLPLANASENMAGRV